MEAAARVLRGMPVAEGHALLGLGTAARCILAQPVRRGHVGAATRVVVVVAPAAVHEAHKNAPALPLPLPPAAPGPSLAFPGLLPWTRAVPVPVTLVPLQAWPRELEQAHADAMLADAVWAPTEVLIALGAAPDRHVRTPTERVCLRE
jgi:hypothetical protein